MSWSQSGYWGIKPGSLLRRWEFPLSLFRLCVHIDRKFWALLACGYELYDISGVISCGTCLCMADIWTQYFVYGASFPHWEHPVIQLTGWLIRLLFQKWALRQLLSPRPSVLHVTHVLTLREIKKLIGPVGALKVDLDHDRRLGGRKKQQRLIHPHGAGKGWLTYLKAHIAHTLVSSRKMKSWSACICSPSEGVLRTSWAGIAKVPPAQICRAATWSSSCLFVHQSIYKDLCEC